MFVEVEHSEYQEVDQIAPAEDELTYLRRRERYLERLSVAALNALIAVDGSAFDELVERAKGWT